MHRRALDDPVYATRRELADLGMRPSPSAAGVSLTTTHDDGVRIVTIVYNIGADVDKPRIASPAIRKQRSGNDDLLWVAMNVFADHHDLRIGDRGMIFVELIALCRQYIERQHDASEAASRLAASEIIDAFGADRRRFVSDRGIDADLWRRPGTRSLVELSCTVAVHFVQVYRSCCEDAFVERVALPAELTQQIFSFVVE